LEPAKRPAALLALERRSSTRLVLLSPAAPAASVSLPSQQLAAPAGWLHACSRSFERSVASCASLAALA
jgi:hypothetical protein